MTTTATPEPGKKINRIGLEVQPYRGGKTTLCAGCGHNAKGQYSERPDDYVNNMDRLLRKFETARQHMPRPEIVHEAGAEIGIIGYGTSHWAIDESRAQLDREFGLRTGYLRLRAYPFTSELDEFLDRYPRIYVVEQNRDAQMLGLMRLDCTPERVARLRSVRHYSGLPIDARSVTDAIEEQEGLKRPHHVDTLVSAGDR